jgi:hypothetical protein
VPERPLLNHVEMLYRPGQRDAARAFFEAFGFAVSDLPNGPWLVITVDPEAGPGTDNVMYANEPTPAQLNLDAALEQALAADPQLAATLERYRAIRWERPQYVFHFGASLPTREDWEERVQCLQEAGRSDPLLAGRVEIKVSEPGMPGALGPMSQAFVYTDILATGPFVLSGVLFDLQWRPQFAAGQLMPPIEFPDMAAMV